MTKALSSLAVLALLVASCKQKPGGTCSAGTHVCEDGHTMLFCLEGKLAEMPCNGPDACTLNTKPNECDHTIANKGDACEEAEEPACTADKKQEVRCRQNHWAVAASCKGPLGCFFTGAKLHCDDDLADLGDPCEENGQLSCSVDKKALYKCDGTKYELASTCKGPKGCIIEGTSAHCDAHIAEVGDACRVERNLACTADQKTLLSCHDGRFKKEKGCGKPCSFAEGDTTKFDCP